MLPHIKREGNTEVFYVADKPYIILGGEVHNSSASCLTYMEDAVWQNLSEVNFNTLLVPVYWELVEPTQDCYDFSLPEGIINQARAHGKKLVFLWFGLWKNSRSTYAPEFIKRNADLFRVKDKYGKPVNVISPFCTKAVELDCKAFAAFMRWLFEYDGNDNTVITVQVENEIGLMDCDRDYGETADKLFSQSVPAEISAMYGVGCWAEVFGGDAGDYFMAYYYALAVERIASAGTKEYPLPMYINTWLVQTENEAPGFPVTHLSGGPTHKVMDIWKAVSKTVFTLAPDIYLENFACVCEHYSREDNTLLIPEAVNSIGAMANALYAIGAGAVCFSPFGFEDMGNTEAGRYLSEAYALIEGMTELIYDRRKTQNVTSFLQYRDNIHTFDFGGYNLRITYGAVSESTPPAAGLVICTGEGEYIITGYGFDLEFINKEKAELDFLSVEEGRFKDGNWIAGRRLNGDETFSFKEVFSKKPVTLKISVYTYNS